MVVRAMTFAVGLAGAATTSQFPEFSQQYAQRLSGAVDELTRIVDDFDSSAQAAGLTRAAALQELSGTAFLERRHTDMQHTIARYERLTQDLAALRGAGPFTRAANLPNMTDKEIAARAWQDFKPAVPLTFEGIIFSIVGFTLASLIFAAVTRCLCWPFRRRGRA